MCAGCGPAGAAVGLGDGTMTRGQQVLSCSATGLLTGCSQSCLPKLLEGKKGGRVTPRPCFEGDGLGFVWPWASFALPKRHS